LQALPLLSPILDIPIPENEFTQNLEPKIRHSALHSLLENCLKAAAREEPQLIVLEDLHWIDALSHDLLDDLSKVMSSYPICIVLAYRPEQSQRLQTNQLEELPGFTKIPLSELNATEAEQAIRAKLAQLYPARISSLSSALVEKLMDRAQGNPFYLEELLNYLRDRGLDPHDPSTLKSLELPDSLHTLILSRIDQLSEREKNTLRVASIIGRLFRARWLTGYFPELGNLPQVREDLDALDRMDITPLDSPEPELAYLFKHIVTHEVTYESLPFATRARLHERLAEFLENASASVDTIAYHYGQSENIEKQQEYLLKAGEAAQKNFANDAALEYYAQLLPLVQDEKEQILILLQRGEVQELIGRFDEAENDYHTALELAKDDVTLKAKAQFVLGKLSRLRGNYEPALAWLTRATETRTALDDTLGLAQVNIETGIVLWRKGEYEQARELLEKGLELSQKGNDKFSTSLALNNLGIVAMNQGNFSKSWAFHEESLALAHDVGNAVGVSDSFNNLGIIASLQGHFPEARTMFEDSLALKREMGDKAGIASSLNNLGGIAQDQGDYATARVRYEESLALKREMGDKWGISILLVNLGNVAYAQADYASARASFEEGLALCEEMDEKTLMAHVLLGLGLVGLAENKPEARDHILDSLRLRQETGEQVPQTSSLIGVASLAFREANPIRAAQFLGAVESALTALNAPMDADILHFYDQLQTNIRSVLGKAVFRSAWEEGTRLSLEEAVEIALDEFL